MSNKNVLTYAIRNADTIVWTKSQSSDGLTSVYTSNAAVYVPYGKYSNVIIGDANITLTIIQSAFSEDILTRQIEDSVIFYDNTPIKGESIIMTTLELAPVIKQLLGSKDKYNIYFQNGTSIDGRANFYQSLGNFSNWTGRSKVTYLNGEKYFDVTYVNYVGAKLPKKV